MHKLRVMILALLAATLFLCTSCGSTAEEPRTAEEVVKSLADKARADGHEEQAAILEDGTITEDERAAAFRSMDECMTAAGIQISEPEVNPVDGFTYLFTIDGPGLDPDVFEKAQTACLESEWNTVDAAYAVTQQPRMEPALAEATRTCMIAQGYSLPEDASAFADFVGDPEQDEGAQREAATECVATQAHIIYPDLTQIAIVQ